MGYNFLKYLSGFIIAFYYRVSYRNLRKLPKGVPMVILANHTNAFLDSLILGGRVPRKMYSLPRGTIFFKQSKFVLMIFNWARMIPVFRQMEGEEFLRRNLESFEFLKTELGNGEGLQIFPEGICIQERRMKSAKKGAAKIILGAEKIHNYKSNTKVVFLGMNYESAPSFNSTLFLNYSRPYSIKEFFTLYQESEGRGINELTKFIGARLKNQMIHIDNQELDELVGHAELIYKPQLFQEHKLNIRSASHKFILSREIAKAVNYFNKREDSRLNMAKEQLNNYVKGINKLGIKDRWLTNQVYLTSIIGWFLLLALTLPFHLYGILTNLIPAGIPKYLANSLVKKDEFYSSVAVLSAMLTYLIVLPLYLLVTSLIFNSFLIGLLFVTSVLLFGKFSTFYLSWLQLFRDMTSALKVKIKFRDELLLLSKLRLEVVNNLSALKADFRNRHKS